ncbi:MAG: glycosyltransferase family 2 protein [Chromatiales bacterium]|nr:glycosyltransferase family 2 protein [Chromatiales bacterium]
MKLTVLICTHNRRELLARTVDSLFAAEKPAQIRPQLVIAANACSDDTHDYLGHLASQRLADWDFRWLPVPTPGKSQALNAALPGLDTDWVVLIDDDHRIPDEFLQRIDAVIQSQPEADLICGCVRPDWSGNEPDWVHERGKYRIYPVPVPHFEPFDQPRELNQNDPIPGGGNLMLSARVVRANGGFSTDLGPVADGLAGSEDTDYVLRALATGFKLYYDPSIVQYHYVDPTRLKLGYVLRKAYERSCSVTRVKTDGSRPPRHLWRKLANYALGGLFAFNVKRARFFAVRVAATLGEIQAYKLGPPSENLPAGNATEPHEIR